MVDHGRILYDPAGKLAATFSELKDRLRKLGSERIVLPDGSWYWDLKPDWHPGEVIEL
jgi:hypothetical protein